MSRSHRKSPIMGMTTARSEKKDKRIANRRLRQRAKVALAANKEILPVLREVDDIWSHAKDGKQMFDPKSDNGKWMRK